MKQVARNAVRYIKLTGRKEGDQKGIMNLIQELYRFHLQEIKNSCEARNNLYLPYRIKERRILLESQIDHV